MAVVIQRHRRDVVEPTVAKVVKTFCVANAPRTESLDDFCGRDRPKALATFATCCSGVALAKIAALRFNTG